MLDKLLPRHNRHDVIDDSGRNWRGAGAILRPLPIIVLRPQTVHYQPHVLLGIAFGRTTPVGIGGAKFRRPRQGEQEVVEIGIGSVARGRRLLLGSRDAASGEGTTQDNQQEEGGKSLSHSVHMVLHLWQHVSEIAFVKMGKVVESEEQSDTLSCPRVASDSLQKGHAESAKEWHVPPDVRGHSLWLFPGLRVAYAAFLAAIGASSRSAALEAMVFPLWGIQRCTSHLTPSERKCRNVCGLRRV